MLSLYAGNAILNALLNDAAFAVAQPYVSLHNADPGLTGEHEFSGNAYGRTAANFGAVSAAAASNSAVINTPVATPMAWSEPAYFGLWDAGSGGNYLGGSALTLAKAILAGEFGQFAIGDLDVGANTQFGAATLDNILKALLNNTTLQIGQTYLSLHSADPEGTGAHELANEHSYGRVPVSFGAAAARACGNDAAAQTPTATGGDWVTGTHVGLWSSGTYGAGTFIWGAPLATPRTVLVGKFAYFAIGDIVVTIQ